MLTRVMGGAETKNSRAWMRRNGEPFVISSSAYFTMQSWCCVLIPWTHQLVRCQGKHTVQRCPNDLGYGGTSTQVDILENSPLIFLKKFHPKISLYYKEAVLSWVLEKYQTTQQCYWCMTYPYRSTFVTEVLFKKSLKRVQWASRTLVSLQWQQVVL